jgi:hypothetical protein
MTSTNSEVLLVADSGNGKSEGIIERGQIQSFIRQKLLEDG